jgi:hypothetical protein
MGLGMMGMMVGQMQRDKCRNDAAWSCTGDRRGRKNAAARFWMRPLPVGESSMLCD